MAGPKKGEVEISLFGPGFGECVLLHLGDGRWVIIDSCRDVRTQKQPALEYLAQIGVDPEAVCAVLATHWHSDHVRGLGEVLRACINAEFFVSEAIKTRELLEMTYSTSLVPSKRSAYRELFDVMEVLKVRHETSAKYPNPKTASAGTMLLPGLDSPILLAISPSSEEVQLARSRMIADLGYSSRVNLVPVSRRPNHLAVALWLKVDNFAAVLGSDLEITGSATSGWQAALTQAGAPDPNASIVKIPHHGSANGQHDELWQNYVGTPSIAMLTPFRNGDVSIPTNPQVQWIKSRAERLFATAKLESLGPFKPSEILTGTMRRFSNRLEDTEGYAGRVTLRIASDCASSPQVSLSNPAREL